MADNNELIDDLVDAAQELNTRYTWGSGVITAKKELSAAREAVLTEMNRLQLHIATLERIIERATKGENDES